MITVKAKAIIMYSGVFKICENKIWLQKHRRQDSKWKHTVVRISPNA